MSRNKSREREQIAVIALAEHKRLAELKKTNANQIDDPKVRKKKTDEKTGYCRLIVRDGFGEETRLCTQFSRDCLVNQLRRTGEVDGQKIVTRGANVINPCGVRLSQFTAEAAAEKEAKIKAGKELERQKQEEERRLAEVKERVRKNGWLDW